MMRQHPTSRPRSFALAAFATIAFVSLTACGSDPVSLAANDDRPFAVERMNTLGAAADGRAAADTARQRRAITSSADWTRFWTTLSADPNAGGSAPAVDFTRDMVIAAVMPLRPSSGYQVEIERVTEYADYIEAAVVERVPAADCITLPVITRPFDAVRVTRREKPVRFTERTATQSCGVAASNDTAYAAFGQPVTARGVKVTLRKVEGDSRCPMNAICVWEGNAAVTLRFEQNAQQSDVTLNTSSRTGPVTVTFGGVEFRLIGLTPYPIAGQPAPGEQSYTAILAMK